MTETTAAYPFFKKIGEIVEGTDDKKEATATNDNGKDNNNDSSSTLPQIDGDTEETMDKAVQEIESYCVQCEENACCYILNRSLKKNTEAFLSFL